MKTPSFLALMFVLLGGFCDVSLRAASQPKAPAQLALPEGIDPEIVREAGIRSVKDLVTRLISQGGTSLRRFAVLPLETDMDGSYFTNQVRDQFSVLGQPAGYELYTRMDDEWNKILEEIGFGQKFEDTMDPASVQKFGRIAGVQGLITGRVVSVTKDGSDAKVRFALRAFEVETGRLLWGGESNQFGKRDGSVASKVEVVVESDLVTKYWWVAVAAAVGLFILGKITRAISAAGRPR